MFVLAAALKNDYDVDTLYELTKIDKWFLNKMKNMVDYQTRVEHLGPKPLTKELLMEGKQLGFSDKQIAICVKSTELAVRHSREDFGR
jgi:carbamoyl-phosphate synthase / aspartate carbamoyltransferase / dihydroorotase